jgi:hypothetical protein
MKERGIRFNGPMVRAILEGRKTQTPRLINWDRQKIDGVRASIGPEGFKTITKNTIETVPWSSENLKRLDCPYGVPGDRLWVRESWTAYGDSKGTMVPKSMLPSRNCDGGIVYRADYPEAEGPWRPSIHLPRWASRITLEITDIRVQRVQEISEEDAKAEGAEAFPFGNQRLTTGEVGADMPFRSGFAVLWDEIYTDRGFPWKSNPWVWAISFKRILL